VVMMSDFLDGFATPHTLNIVQRIQPEEESESESESKVGNI